MWSTRTQSKLYSINQDEMIRSYTFSPDGSRLVIANWRNDVSIYDSADGRLLATLHLVRGTSDWIAFTPDGHVDGTPGGFKQLVRWRVGEEVFDSERYLDKFQIHGLLGSALGVAKGRPF